jgi:hypothetical protein
LFPFMKNGVPTPRYAVETWIEFCLTCIRDSQLYQRTRSLCPLNSIRHRFRAPTHCWAGLRQMKSSGM